jgi:NAD(P)-dependent dehydrogenase (short-subunit alcohol dehydrogenase family)
MSGGKLCIVGATGATGRRVARLAVEQGADLVLAGRSLGRLEALAADIGGGEPKLVDLDRPETLDAALADAAVVASCAGPFTEVGHPVAEAAVRHGAHYVDTTGEPRFSLALVDELDRPAARRGVALVTACGASSVPADLAAATALAEPGLERISGLTVAYRIAGMRPTAGTLRSTIAITAGGAVAWDGAALVLRPAGGRPRRLPSGTGIRFASPDPVVISRYCPVPVDTFIVVPGAGAVGRLMSAGQRLLADPRRRERLRRMADRLPCTDDGRPHGRFSVEATVWGRHGAHSAVASGADVYGFTARAVMLVATALTGYRGEGGVRAPSQVLVDTEKAAVELDLRLSRRRLAPGQPIAPGRVT